jgi:probable selenium-dependent hydroxylase accessory protein YqeC
MKRCNAQTTLTEALGITGPQLVAFVGAGGKTTALQRLAVEHASLAGGVVATTTTAMFTRELACLAPVDIAVDGRAFLAAHPGDAVRAAKIVALARSFGDDGKVKGLTPAEVDAIWRAQVADLIVVEADGSRCLPLKAFGVAEPQLPAEATVVVVVAGLDVVGQPLDEAHVHRAEVLTSLLHTAMGETMTVQLLAAAVALQVERVHECVPRARVIVLLNKADSGDRADDGAETAARLLTGAAGAGGTAPADAFDRVLVTSLWRGACSVVRT